MKADELANGSVAMNIRSSSSTDFFTPLIKLLIACNHGSYWSFDEMDPMQTNVQSSKKIVYQNKQLTSVQTTKYQHPKTLVLECNQPLKNSDEIIYTNELLALFFKG